MSLIEDIGIYVFVGVMALSLIALSDILFGESRPKRRKRLLRSSDIPSYDDAGLKRLYRTMLRKIRLGGE